MARIKVTGYIDTDDLGFDDLDLGHVMGVSDQFYSVNANGMTLVTADGASVEMTENDFELQPEP